MSSLKAFEHPGCDSLKDANAGVSEAASRRFFVQQARNAAKLERIHASLCQDKAKRFSYRFTSAVKGFVQVLKGDGVVVPVHICSQKVGA